MRGRKKKVRDEGGEGDEMILTNVSTLNVREQHHVLYSVLVGSDMS